MCASYEKENMLIVKALSQLKSILTLMQITLVYIGTAHILSQSVYSVFIGLNDVVGLLAYFVISAMLFGIAGLLFFDTKISWGLWIFFLLASLLFLISPMHSSLILFEPTILPPGYVLDGTFRYLLPTFAFFCTLFFAFGLQSKDIAKEKLAGILQSRAAIIFRWVLLALGCLAFFQNLVW